MGREFPSSGSLPRFPTTAWGEAKTGARSSVQIPHEGGRLSYLLPSGVCTVELLNPGCLIGDVFVGYLNF